MFDMMVRQLQHGVGERKNFTITQEEYEQFRKEFIFDELKGISMGEAFCAKYKDNNLLLSTMKNKYAREHIEMFYLKK